MKKDLAYDKKYLIGSIVGLIAMGLAMRFTAGLAFALIFPLIFAGFGRNKTELLFYSILMTIAMTMSNGAVIPKSFSFGIMARATFCFVGASMILMVVGQRTSRLITPVLSILFYVAYMALVSYFGWMPLLSYLKLFLFTIIFLAFYGVATLSSTRQGVDAYKLRSVILSFALFFIVGSVLLIPFPGLLYMNAAEIEASGGIVEGTLFKGMTLHSQALGPVVAALATLLLGDLLFSVRRWDKLYLLMLICSPILIYKTGSRTAMGTYLAGACFIIFLFMNATFRGHMAQWKSKALSVLMGAGILMSIALFATPKMRKGVADFVLKYGDSSVEAVTMKTVMNTRQGSMDKSMESFHESPWIGNGFQVADYHKDMPVYTWKQLLTAPVEKGVWVTAVLEEGGVFGMILFVIFALTSITCLWGRRAYVGLAVLFVMLVCNLGEFTMFSMTSTGGLTWALVFAGLALDVQRERAQRQTLSYMPPQFAGAYPPINVNRSPRI